MSYACDWVSTALELVCPKTVTDEIPVMIVGDEHYLEPHFVKQAVDCTLHHITDLFSQIVKG